MKDVLIVEAVRTPFSPFGGLLKDIPSIELGACVIKEIVKRARLKGDQIDEIFYGMTQMAEAALYNNVCARQAALIAGLPSTQVSLTVDRACCSSMASAILAFRTIRSMEGDVMMAVGAENMSRTPQIAPPEIRWGQRMGPIVFRDCLSPLGHPGFPPESVNAGKTALEYGIGREDGVRMEIRGVGVLGAGAMGSGIAQAIAQAGLPVRLMDLSDALVREGIEKIGKNLSRSVEKGKLSFPQKDDILKKINPTIDIRDMKDCGLIIEAVFEDLELKLNLFQSLDALCPPETVFASNTSTFSITRMAAGVARSGRFLGLHFFNPVPVMRLVEVIPGLQTSQETVDQAIDFIKRIKKVPVVAKDCPGFLVNRIVMPYAGEAMLAAQEGAALPTEIDEAMKKAGFPMGPLALNDLVGIDVGVHTFPPMHEGYGEKFPVPVLFERLLEAGRRGSKSGKGIYINGLVDDEFLDSVNKIQSETGIKRTEFSADRLILRQVNEAVCCLQEKIASAEGIDRAMVLGTGFPADENGVGGPLHWADERGLDWVLDKLNYFKRTLGTRFWPHFPLKQYVAAGYLGRKTKKGFFEYG